MERTKFCLTTVTVVVLSMISFQGQAAEALPSPTPKPDWLATVLHAAVPRTYDNRKHWGKTKSVVVGIRGKLFDPRLHRKELRHGTWRRNEIRLVEPEKRLKLAIHDVERIGPARQKFRLSAKARVRIILQQQQWRRDLRLYSISGESIADLEMDLMCEMAMKVAPAALLPSITLEPVVKDADIRLKGFRLVSVGDARGPVVHEMGELFEGLVRDELKDKEASIVKKINRSIDKRKDRLKISVTDLASGALTKHFDLPKFIGADKNESAKGK